MLPLIDLPAELSIWLAAAVTFAAGMIAGAWLTIRTVRPDNPDDPARGIRDLNDPAV